ncbi:MAG: IS110 family transposase [Streptosporangiaceae bacterium]
MGHARARKIPARLVEDEEYQLRHERVAGIDIAKDKGDVCVRLPPVREGGRRVSRTETLPATWREVTALGERLLADGVEAVVMESTSDYWRIWYYLLEAAGLAVLLVSPSHARQLAGRPKADRLDCQWLARLAEMGLLRPSFVPPPEIRALRDLTRARLHLVRDRTRLWQRLEKLLEGALIRLSTSVGAMAGNQSAWRILEAIADGESDPAALAALAHHAVKGGRDGVRAALEGMMPGEHHHRLIRTCLTLIKALGREIDAIEDEVDAHMESAEMRDAWGVTADGAPSPDPGPDAAVLAAAQRLDEIPGVSLELAVAIIAETGLDMTRFPTAARLVSWAGLSPVARQSGSQAKKAKKGKGNAYLKGYCSQAATGASKSNATFLGERYHRLARRIGAARAQVAVARSILVIVWHLLSDPAARYTDLGPGWHARKTSRDRATRNHVRQLQALGHHVTLTPAA